MSTNTYSSSRLNTRPTAAKPKLAPHQQALQHWSHLTLKAKGAVIGCSLLCLGSLWGLHHASDAAAPGNLFAYPLSAGQVQEVSRTLSGWQVVNTVDAAGDNVLVAPDQRARLMMQLSLLGLPHPDNAPRPSEKFQTGSAAALQHQHELEYSLVESIRQIEGVQDGRVNLAMADNTGFADSQKSSASVFLTLLPGRELKPEQASGIAHLVAAAVPGLDDEAVAITDNSGRTVKRHQAPAADSFQLDIQKEMDGYLVGKAQAMLDQTFGPGRASAVVNAQFDFSQIEIKRTENGKPGDGETVTVEQRTEEHFNKPGEAPVDVEQPQTPGKNYEKVCEAKRVKADERYTWTVNKVPRVSKLTCAVSLTERGEEDKARRVVAGAIGLDESRGDYLEVVTHPHGPTMSLVPAPPAAATPTASALPPTLPFYLMGLCVPFSLLVCVFALKRGGGVAGIESGLAPSQPLQTQTDLLLNSRGQGTRTDHTEVMSNQKLHEMVQSNPREVANHLRTLFSSRND